MAERRDAASRSTASGSHPTVAERPRPKCADVLVIAQNPMGSLNPSRSRGRSRRAHRASIGSHADRSTSDLLHAFGLGETLAFRRPRELSGGQRQRVALARALAPGPAVPLCNEVT
jgi:peptide/nickel transport system ATP-binding protein